MDMNAHKYIKGNKGVIRTLFNLGLIPPSVLNGFKTYQYYHDCMQLLDDKKDSIKLTADKFKITTRSVYNVIKVFEQELRN